jgi:DNA helicase IV
VARTKGGLAMLDVLRRAVADRQELPGSPIAIALDDVTVEIDRATAAEARRRARATGLPHNAARTTFRDTLGSLLVQQGVERLDRNLADPPELAELLRGLGDLPEIEPAAAAQLSAELRHELRDDLRSDLGFHAAVERLWPVLTPEQLLAELFASPDRLASAAGEIDLSGLYRAERSAWTVADAPLLDELAELLGPPPVLPGGRHEPARGPDSAYAAEVLSILESTDRQVAGEDPDELRPTDFVTADVLAARQVSEHLMSVAERAAADRDWRYGHLVVDEAQELSAMDWHVLLRRCPSHSITAVGDLAQRCAPAGAQAWADVLAPHVGSRWTYRTLTVNYRTPAEIMTLAAAVLAEFAPDRQPPESVRATGEDPWQRTVPATDLAAEMRRAVEAEVAQLGRGTLAVIAADGDRLAGLAGLPVQLHTPVSAKGLEFDVVVIVDPERIRAHNPADLYVSTTRATQRLGLLRVER